ncbi:Putative prenylcysteine lyase, prenylcysteine oxidase, FAD/NAD(P)-binding domain superfamily [Septoria linicola]|uniref:Prenylcysteine lyase, prenylcysteine oxidase, FAD/NAD(P)-binding domain superfamily n=1 Tax=Septoria linicola TaxID=215465 RepID=A0A9Q9B003_9PEZI|nr:Putative prenylcysteine lyase, prenylcysteine oxidase, FAD/NAD(P)-binding domain superfamily [Septoria linicola]
MKLTSFACTLLAGVFAASQHEQPPLQHNKPVEIAIIGAGAAGSSAAYYLSQYARNASIPINITLFEANSYIGGRSTTVNAYDLSDEDISTIDELAPDLEHEYTVELGASIFVSVNQILQDALTTFNLSTKGGDDNPKGHKGSQLGVWDGDKFVVELDGSLNGYWDVAKLLWRYGLAPVKTQRLMKKVVGKFLNMYEEPTFPFKSITAAAQAVGLLAVTAATGEQYLRENGITGPFGREIVQASTRVNYAQNLEHIHGLEAMVCMATDGAMAVEGGNRRIFASMVKASGANVFLNKQVHDIQETGPDGYTVQARSADSDDVLISTADHIIVAGPWQYTNLTFNSTKTKTFQPPDQIPYVQLHVTLFTSTHLLNPAFFGLSHDKVVPQVILTTLPSGSPTQPGNQTAGKPGFFSISLLRSILNPHSGADEYLYKVFSPHAPTSAWLEELLGIKPENSNPNRNADDITWLYRKVWNSYPYEYPRVTFEDAKLEEGLWYTGGMDSFISTMETNALMGRNVARLIVDEEEEWREMEGWWDEGGDGYGEEGRRKLLAGASEKEDL